MSKKHSVVNKKTRKESFKCQEKIDNNVKSDDLNKKELNNKEKLEARKNRCEQRKQLREKIKQSRKELLERQEADGIVVLPQISVPNAKSACKSEEEELAVREEAVASQIVVYRAMLPQLFKRLLKIPDPRNPATIKHKMTTLILYGILFFVFQMASRREANQTMSRPVFFNTLKEFFPDLESIPHADTLNRLLKQIDILEIEAAHIGLIQKFVRNKKFYKYLISKCFPIALDGTQKLVRDGDNWPEEWSERTFKTNNGERKQRHVYVLEANLVFHNGMTIPLLSEFVSYTEGDPDDDKQDCELKAFNRLSKTLKGYFPRLPIMVLLDGLYPNGPLMQSCKDNNWQFMIVLPDKCLSNVWDAAKARRKAGFYHELERNWQGRRQYFWWTNSIEYSYYDDDKKQILINLVVCYEEFEEVDKKTGDIITKEAYHSWISSHPLQHDNVHERCNLGARHRWGIEDSIRTEKHGGYNYKHVFSHNWNAMKGYHLLMRLAHMMNAIALHTKRVAIQVRKMGIQAFLKFIRETCANPWLSSERIKNLLIAPFKIQFQ